MRFGQKYLIFCKRLHEDVLHAGKVIEGSRLGILMII